MKIRKAVEKDLKAVLEMALFLWPDESAEQQEKPLREILASKKQIILVSLDEKGNYAGFIIVSIRSEYVTGATSYPVGHVEGIYVKKPYRLKGLARKLLEAGEKWAAANGCQQIASDTWLWDTPSQEFHNKVGFMEKERQVLYIKRIETE
jgi:aminoglycoside 6'-N-acetyltransferase I